MAAKYPIGRMNRRVIIESFSTTTDGQGGVSETWTTFATVAAKIVKKSGREMMFADKIRPTKTHEITIRWLDGLNESMRIRLVVSTFLTRTYHIHRIDWTDEKRFQLVLDCEENVES